MTTKKVTTPKFTIHGTPQGTLCADGRAHNYKDCPLGNGQFYYERVGIRTVKEQVFDKYDRDANGNATVALYKEANKTETYDVTPGRHYRMVFCTKCGAQREILVKDHGDQYEVDMRNLTPEQRSQITRGRYS